MIYLLSQMILALAVAVVLGVALGWLIHRTTYSQKNHRLKQTIASLHNRLAQTQSEVSMLTDDYDELQRQSQDQIIALREENRQIPDLNSNLEKSQLLVRQMMQRHETKVRELGKDNQKLSAKLAKLEEQEQTKNQLSAELDKRKRDSTTVESEQASDDQPSDQLQPFSNAPVSPASTQIMDDEDPTKAMRTSASGIAKPNPGKPALFAAAESDADPFDQVMEVEDELQRELDMTAERKTAAGEMDAVSDLSESFSSPSPDGSEPELRLNSTSPNSSTSYSTKHIDLNRKSITLNADVPDVPYSEQSDLSQSIDNADDLDNLIALDDVGEFTDSFSALGDTFSQTSDMDDLDPVDSTHKQTVGTDSTIEQPNPIDLNSDVANTAERSNVSAGEDALQLDGSSDDSMLFEPVSQHDDLQQIFGIGPLTEKALNELGITSYSQLAELKQQEIQHIADALEIGPGRIERDNWVGNARRQLEDVLEQL